MNVVGTSEKTLDAGLKLDHPVANERRQQPKSIQSGIHADQRNTIIMAFLSKLLSQAIIAKYMIDLRMPSVTLEK